MIKEAVNMNLSDDSQDSKQRVLAAMNHRELDRVPVMCQLALGHYFLNCDYSPSQIWFDTETFAHALVDLQRRYEFDGILVNLPGRPPDWKSKLNPTTPFWLKIFRRPTDIFFRKPLF